MNNPALEKSSSKLLIPSEQHVRNAYAATVVMLIAIIPTIALFGYFGFINNQWQPLAVAGALLAAMFADFSLTFLIKRGRSNLAMMILMTNFVIVVLVTTLLIQGLGIIIAIATILTVIAISSLTMPPRYAASGVIVATAAGAGLFLLDYFLGARLVVPQIESYAPYITAMLAGGFVLLGSRGFNKTSLRVKITLGIIITGAITVSVLVFFGLNRSDSLVNSLLNQYKNSNSANVEQRIVTEVDSSAKQINELFISMVSDINVLAGYRSNLEREKETLSQGAYWDSRNRLYRLAGGQYGNLTSDPASIFIPSTITVDDPLLFDLNTTAYLDFYALDYLKDHEEVVAVYFISKTGATTYYPNINLANVLAPTASFDPRTQPFYTISDPANGSKREPNWVRAYQDPAGQGLLVTLSAPVYLDNDFLGVIGFDIQLDKLLARLQTIKIGETGYAFMIDGAGRILVMPPQGYILFGMQAEQIQPNESPEQTIIGRGSNDLQTASARIINGHTGVEGVSYNNEKLYVVFAPLTVPNYRMGYVVPEKEFTANILKAESDAQTEIQNTLRTMTFILVSLLVGALLISLAVGQVITRPLTTLTQTVEALSEGNLAVRADASAEDETGILASAFNAMADRLSRSMVNLEESVSDRTRELEQTNETIARRATQFEAISRIARTISTTQTLDTLLPQIVETISNQFNFYHVGIFMLDSRREYAILVAANSEGGKRMLERNHRLTVGETGIVGYVTSVGQPRVALDVGADASYFNNPDLPNTHSEIALPLRVGADTFGALDVQSTEANAFTDEDINILSTLADQVSIAIQNARSYQQSREALEQAERVSSQLSGQQWKRFVEQLPIAGYHFDGIETKAATPEQIQRAHNLTIPLELRGTRIGAIRISALDVDHEWSDDELAMMQAAADRASLALENARLLEESQKRAAKERAIGEISAKIGGVTDLESIIQTAIKELGNTLPGADIAVQFKED